MKTPSFARRLLGAASLTLLLAPTLRAHDVPPAAPYPDRAAHAPRPLPDRVVLTWRGDPASTQAVTWRADSSVRRAEAQVGLANESGRNLKWTTVPAVTTPHRSSLGEAHYHSAEFTGLESDTLYAYRVRDGVNWSEWFHFQTAARAPRRFSFIYFGDAQNDIRSHWSRVFREAFRESPRAAFTLHAGDLVNNAHHDGQWGEWFGAPAWVNATVSPLLRRAWVSPAGRFVAVTGGRRMTCVMRATGISSRPAAEAMASRPSWMDSTRPSARS